MDKKELERAYVMLDVIADDVEGDLGKLLEILNKQWKDKATERAIQDELLMQITLIENAYHTLSSVWTRLGDVLDKPWEVRRDP